MNEYHSQCWSCGTINVMATNPQDPDSRPTDGDVSMCFHCGSLAIFDSKMPDMVRKPSPSEQDVLMADPTVQQVLMAWHTAAQQAADDFEDWRAGEENA